MHKFRLTANVIIVCIVLSFIIVEVEGDENGSSKNKTKGEMIVWPSTEPYHEQHEDEIILAPAGGTDTPFTYNDYDFEVEDYATKGIIIVGNFSNVGAEDVDIVLFGAKSDEDGNRKVVASSESGAPEERIDIYGTPDPEDLDNFHTGGSGTWALRVYNYASAYSFVTYDVSIDIYYEGAEFFYVQEY